MTRLNPALDRATANRALTQRIRVVLSLNRVPGTLTTEWAGSQTRARLSGRIYGRAFGWRSAFSAAIQAAESEGFSRCGAASSTIPVLAEL